MNPSRRGIKVCFTGLGIAVIAILLLFVWPAFLVPTKCTSSPSVLGVPTMLVDNHTYCFETVYVPPPASACLPVQNGTPESPATVAQFWGFTFHLVRYDCTDVASLFASVSEPNGTIYYGGLAVGCPEPMEARCAGPWFTPDNESGVGMAHPLFGNFTLYVEVGK